MSDSNFLFGIALDVDSSLDKLGSWGKTGVLFLDPTGITGWKDLGDSLQNFLKEGTLKSAGELGMSALGALPMFGFIGKLGKLSKLGDVSKTTKLVSKSKKLLDPDTYKALVDSSLPVAHWMARNFTPEMKEEAVKVLDGEIVKIVDWCKNNNIKKVPKKLEDKITNLAEKLSTIMGSNVDSNKLIDSINLELNDFN